MRLKILFKTLGISCIAILVTACANIAKTPDNTNLSTIVERFGHPTLSCQTDQGINRVIWSQQPMGQYAWGGNLDNNHNLAHMQSLLTDEHFAVLSQGIWNKDKVFCEFGPPAFIDKVNLPGDGLVVWNYRYKQDYVWNSLMFVFFDPKTNIVVNFYPGPDPMYDPDNKLPGF